MFIKFAHDGSQNKHFLNSVQDCLDRYCAILKSQKQKKLKTECRNLIPLKIEELEFHKSQNYVTHVETNLTITTETWQY